MWKAATSPESQICVPRTSLLGSRLYYRGLHTWAESQTASVRLTRHSAPQRTTRHDPNLASVFPWYPGCRQRTISAERLLSHLSARGGAALPPTLLGDNVSAAQGWQGTASRLFASPARTRRRRNRWMEECRQNCGECALGLACCCTEGRASDGEWTAGRCQMHCRHRDVIDSR